jgi:hypothetical protein
MRTHAVVAILVLSGVALLACSSGGGAQKTGMSCTQATDCYPGVDAGTIAGQVRCLGLQGGYCSHTCTTDTDCCKAPGECATGIKEVCAPLESNPQTYCFVSCAAADIAPTPDGGADPNAYCRSVAGSTFTCRSTGGGSNNKKFCAP